MYKFNVFQKDTKQVYLFTIFFNRDDTGIKLANHVFLVSSKETYRCEKEGISRRKIIPLRTGSGKEVQGIAPLAELLCGLMTVAKVLQSDKILTAECLSQK